MKETNVLTTNYQAEDGKIFSNFAECFAYETNLKIRNGQEILINDLISDCPFNNFECHADSYVDFWHGPHKGELTHSYTRLNLITKHLKENSSFDKKKVVYIDYCRWHTTIYVHFGRKEWNEELQNIPWWKNPSIVSIRKINFENF